jgi:DNA polymerase I
MEVAGQVRDLCRFQEVWCVDFEFRADPGERPWPVCLVAREYRLGHEIRLWRDQLLPLRRAPFETGPDALFVAYFASAELGCFLVLGWPLPANILDLFTEHRVQANGIPGVGNSLLAALAHRGISHVNAPDKDVMRDLIIHGTEWTASEQREILDYCASDVVALTALLPRMRLDHLPQALLRGRYTAAVARMEHAGVPIDCELLGALQGSWEDIKMRLVETVDRDFGVYEGTSFRSARFEAWLKQNGIPWPRRPSGALCLDDDAFRSQAKHHSTINSLHELRSTLGQLKLHALAVGSDGRNRCLLSPFQAATGRNLPSNSKFVFGPARWLRGLIKPPPGLGLAYVDWSCQEIVIAAALSGDGRLAEAYRSGDPYLGFAKQAGLVPPDATKKSHKAERDRCKAVVLGVGYGLGAESLAVSLGIPPIEARQLLALHRDTYPDYWRWVRQVIDDAILTRRQRTMFGWHRWLFDLNPRAAQNFPMQSHGAEMMRLAAIASTEAGIEVCCPVHDAFLIAAPAERLDQDVARMQELMSKAGAAITGGLEVRTDCEVVKYPHRYMDERGSDMWRRIMGLLAEAQMVAA